MSMTSDARRTDYLNDRRVELSEPESGGRRTVT
jgi:hypothetical protein